MPCVLKLIMDLILGPEEKIAYVSVTATTRASASRR
jgi:hypothetical protein